MRLRLLSSLRGRQALSALVILMLFLGLSGYVLDRAFTSSVENALSEHLKAHIYALLAAAEDQAGTLHMPSLLQDPELNRLESGRYARISDAEDAELWRSASALGQPLPKNGSLAVGAYLFSTELWGGTAYYRLDYGVIWENEDDSERYYRISVFQNQTATNAEIDGFRSTLWRWLGGIGLLLFVVQIVILHWGLAPLSRLAREVQRVECGEQEQLTGDYPLELTPLAVNLNRLIANERLQRQRYRNTLADLAHSLKTPLAVLRGAIQPHETSAAEQQVVVEEQIQRMDDIVRYQLQRASAGSNSFSGTLVPLNACLEKLTFALNKVYQEKKVELSLEAPTDLWFAGDEGDLLELMGNLLDNAYKFCEGRVRCRCESFMSAEGSQKLRISIENDGPPIASEQRSAILSRGVRADSSQPGQGIGLAVALEIIQAYGGSLDILDSELGGARFCLELPGKSR